MFQSYLNYVWVDLEGSLVCMVWADRAVDVSHWCVTATDGFLLSTCSRAELCWKSQPGKVWFQKSLQIIWRYWWALGCTLRKLLPLRVLEQVSRAMCSLCPGRFPGQPQSSPQFQIAPLGGVGWTGLPSERHPFQLPFQWVWKTTLFRRICEKKLALQYLFCWDT